MAYRRASLIDLYLHTKFHRNRKNFFLDGRTFEPHIDIIRSTLRSRPNNNNDDYDDDTPENVYGSVIMTKSL